jgi:F420-dependent oxidoreductase-like protein
MAGARLTRRGFVVGMGGLAAAGAVGARLGRPPAARAATPPGRLRFGVQTPPQLVRFADLAGVWEEADALGYDSAFVFDHFMPIRSDPNGSCFEGWTLLTALAARTKRIRAGVLVTGNTYRNPALLAKMAATVDHASNGRLILGIGAGWYEEEHKAYGFPFYTPGVRARRLVESVEIITRLFTQERTTYAGKYYTLADAPFEPKPLQKPRPPILIGGMGPKVVQPLAARHADIWHFFAPDDVAEVRKVVASFDDLVRQAKREPAAVEKAVSVRAQDLDGADGVEKTRERVRALAGLGVGHFVLSLYPPFDRAVVRRFAKEVVPAAREAG